MQQLAVKLWETHYQFKSIKELLAKANEPKSGDQMAGLAASDARERVAAKTVLAEIPLHILFESPSVPYEKDEITKLSIDSLDNISYQKIKNWTVSQLREWILQDTTSGEEILKISPGLTAEMVSAVTKLMTNMDLIIAGKKIRVVVKCNATLGLAGRISSRLQTNHPTDDVTSIIAGAKEGLSYGTGDAVIGINPSTDKVDNCIAILRATKDLMQKYKIPTQNCVLAHVTTQMRALEAGAPLDLMFQSIAGSEATNKEFGVSIKLLDEAYEMTLKKGTALGPNVMYFETGQGTALSANAHYNTDQLTMEARAYALARRYKPYLVNSVVGFIGPEYLYDAKQIIRAGLEDHFMGKLMGISMGCDDCYTNHAVADQNDQESLAVLLASAGVNYLMSLPMGDDVMLNYQSTSFHDNASLRTIFNFKPTPEFEKWMERLGLWQNGRLTEKAGDARIFS
ncbi:MAG: ethanolamine ammonia-lyase subunit EutB [Oligoflexia bacterium]|nr:ethanolamine ammonia-lyase subunit EutB [Oligoflexia bacterium]